MNKAIIYTIVISLVVVAIGGWMVFCGTNMGVHLDLFSAPNKPRLYRKYMLLYIGGLIILLGLTLIPMIGYCVQMSMEKNEARREQIDANGLDPQNYAANSSNDNANENYRVAVTNHLLQRAERGTLDLKSLPCQNCNLISMGSMACYQRLCPECGRPPPK